MDEYAYCGSHKADDDFAVLKWRSEGRIGFIHEFRGSFKLGGGAVVKELCSAMKQGSPHVRRDSDEENAIFGTRSPECLGMATAHDLFRIIRNINLCREFELLEVKVPVNFLGT